MVTSRDLEGRRILVTGAARGMGRSHALAAAERGAAVALLDVTAAAGPLGETAREAERHGVSVTTATADVRDWEALSTAVTVASVELGGLDGLVANAGVAPLLSFSWETPLEEWDRVVSINLAGTFLTLRAAIPHLIDSGATGSVVLIASTAATSPLPLAACYNASKAGVVALGRTLAQELGPHGVRCNTVLPGSVDTPMTDGLATQAGTPRDEILQNLAREQILQEVVQPEAVSDAVMFLLSDAARMITGTELVVDAGLTGKHASIPDGQG